VPLIPHEKHKAWNTQLKQGHLFNIVSGFVIPERKRIVTTPLNCSAIRRAQLGILSKASKKIWMMYKALIEEEPLSRHTLGDML